MYMRWQFTQLSTSRFSRTNRSCGWGELLIKYRFWPLEMSRIRATRELKSCSSIQTIGNSWYVVRRGLNLSVWCSFFSHYYGWWSAGTGCSHTSNYRLSFWGKWHRRALHHRANVPWNLLTVILHFLSLDKSNFPRWRWTVHVPGINPSTARICDKSHSVG